MLDTIDRSVPAAGTPDTSPSAGPGALQLPRRWAIPASDLGALGVGLCRTPS